MKNSAHVHQIVDLIFAKLQDEGYLDNCTTCMHWNETKEMCNKFNQRPPAKVIVQGCLEHQLIPF